MGDLVVDGRIILKLILILEFVMGVNGFSCHVMKSKIAFTETIVKVVQ